MSLVRNRSDILSLFVLLVPLLGQMACASAPAPAPGPMRSEWETLMADYQWIETLRGSQVQPLKGASRKEAIEVVLGNLKKIQPIWVPFMDRLKEYADRTGDERAARLWSEEMAMLGDEYLEALSRPDRALAVYRTAIAEDPSNEAILDRIARAERLRWVDQEAFSRIQAGTTESEVIELVGRPREDWVRQIRREGHVYSVWIYPKSDGGAAAVYMNEGVVYHADWDAAAGRKGSM